MLTSLCSMPISTPSSWHNVSAVPKTRNGLHAKILPRKTLGWVLCARVIHSIVFIVPPAWLYLMFWCTSLHCESFFFLGCLCNLVRFDDNRSGPILETPLGDFHSFSAWLAGRCRASSTTDEQKNPSPPPSHPRHSTLLLVHADRPELKLALDNIRREPEEALKVAEQLGDEKYGRYPRLDCLH